jgi:excisionase family DNA binding protein
VETNKEYLTVKEAAQILNASNRFVYSLIQSGKLKADNLGERKTIIKRSEIDKLFA